MHDRALRIGILGGGQLARMLALAAHNMGLEPWVYCSDKTDPAAQVTSHIHIGGLDDVTSLRRFLKETDVATFESEFLSPQILKKALEKSSSKILPTPTTMAILQDRLSQKNLLIKYKIPTSPFIAVKSINDVYKAHQLFAGKFVLKKRHGGYDGYGTYVITSREEIENFKPVLANETHGFIAEKYIRFKRELALSAVRNKGGQIVFLPTVETKQENSRCLWVKGPIHHAEIKRLQRRITNFLGNIGYVGVMAFEIFDSTSGLLINEVAPRVHNSAHYSLDALDFDQFSLHILALLNRKLIEPRALSAGFGMLNLLGRRKQPAHSPLTQVGARAHLHWYGKQQERPGRKMGHLNFLSPTPDKALQQILLELKKSR